MDREKLEKAAKKFAAWETINSSERMSNFYCSLGFSKGADWLMQQPISERLTEEEKEKIIDIMKYPQRHTEPIKGTMHFQVLGIKRVLAEIFGKDLFKEK